MSASKRELLRLVNELMGELVRFREHVDSEEDEEDEEDEIEDNVYEDQEQDE